MAAGLSGVKRVKMTRWHFSASVSNPPPSATADGLFQLGAERRRPIGGAIFD
jgi:hypothetical protein